MLAKQLVECARVDERSDERPALAERGHTLTKWPCGPEPVRQRHGEADFRAIHDRTRNPPLADPLQQRLSNAAAQFYARRERIGPLDEEVIEEDDARFDARRHRHAILPLEERR